MSAIALLEEITFVTALESANVGLCGLVSPLVAPQKLHRLVGLLANIAEEITFELLINNLG